MEAIRVVLVEADPASGILAEAFFTNQTDITLCAVARDGLEGLEHIRRLRPDVVLMELTLPGMDGMGLLRALKAENFDPAPIVIVTSCIADQRVISYAVALGAHYYVIKPIDYEELLQTIKGLQEESLEDKARQLLLDLGAPEKCKGLPAAAEAAAAIARTNNGKMLLKEAYYKTIRAEHTDYTCVEKNIRYVVGRIHSAQKELYWSLMGEKPATRPNNEVFLHKLAKFLRGG